jgi:putative membrane protein
VIVRDRPTFWDVLFAAQGAVLPRILPNLIALALWGAAVVAADRYMLPLPRTDATPFALFGIALSLFLGFRNNAAWDRWWEARRLWGGVLSDMRSLARDAALWLGEADRTRILRLGLAFTHLHRLSLRGLAPDATAERHLAAANLPPGPPGSALNRMAEQLVRARREGRLEALGARALAERLASLTAHQTGAERIANTPLPFVYSLLVYRTSYLFCLLLPLALVGSAGWLTPLFMAIVGYVFLGLAEVAEELGYPYGDTPNALPIDAICRNVESSLAPHLGEMPPEPLLPRRFLLT